MTLNFWSSYHYHLRTRFPMCAPTPDICGSEDQAWGFVHDCQESYQLNCIPRHPFSSPSFEFFPLYFFTLSWACPNSSFFVDEADSACPAAACCSEVRISVSSSSRVTVKCITLNEWACSHCFPSKACSASWAVFCMGFRFYCVVKQKGWTGQAHSVFPITHLSRQYNYH